MKNLAYLMIVAGVTIIAAFATIRAVQAEDDCADHTLFVERLPVVGLVCVFEP